MGLIIQGNLLALNAANNSKINSKSRSKATERLSSGLRINRAADDAAGLSISEKMRRQIRGLNQGAENAQDGVSFAQIGDGSLNEVDDMIHRMTELSVKAANGSLSASDRADIQAEFRQLQMEIDHVTENSIFNETHIFSEHEPTFNTIDGNKVWDQGQLHVIDDENDSMTIVIQKDKDAAEQSFTITVKPHGNYTTAELNSAIDDALISSGAAKAGVEVVYKMDGTFDVSYEGGKDVKSIEGGLSYLLYDMYNGASTGALIGSTIFTSDDARLQIKGGQNDNLSFDIVDFSGNVTTKNITLPSGYYTRKEIMDMLNNELSDTSVTAVAKGTGIKLETNEAIITRFKGNMFKIEVADPKYTSVFYDNVKYGEIYPKSASFTGGYVLNSTGNKSQEAFSKYNINSDNNTLSIKPNGGDTTYTVTIPEGEYTAAEMASKLNALFEEQGAPVTVSSSQYQNYSGLTLTSKTKGVTSDVGVISSSSAYNTLFVDRKSYIVSPTQSRGTETTPNKDATFTGGNNSISSTKPLVIEEGVNDAFKLYDGNDGYTIQLTARSYTSAADVCSEINARISELPILNGRVSAVVYSNAVRLKSASSANMITNLYADKADSTNKGYSDIFIGKTDKTTQTSVSGTKKITTTEHISEPVEITSGNRTLGVYIGNDLKTVDFPPGSYDHQQIIDKINETLIGSSQTTDNKFTTVSDTGTSYTTDVTSNNVAGQTSIIPKTYSNTGTFKSKQGSTEADINIPAKITVDGATIPSNTSIGNDNNQIEITVNNVTKEITLDNGNYNQSGLASMIQSKINSAYAGSEVPGVTVSISNGHLVFEAKLGAHLTGDETNITLHNTGSGNSFIEKLHTTYTPGTATSSVKLQSEFHIDDSTKDFTFSVDGHQYTVQLPQKDYTSSSFADELTNLIKSMGAKASVDPNGRLVLTTTKSGSGNSVSYNSSTGSNSSADRLFGPRTTDTSASVLTDRNLQQPITISSGSNILRLSVDGSLKEVALNTGTYQTRQSFVNMVKTCLSEQNTGATANLSNNRIGYTSNTKGTQSKISISYDTRTDSAMRAMYGSQHTVVPTVTASFNSSDQLVLETEGNYTLKVTSNYGSVFQKPTISTVTTNPSRQTGYNSPVIPYAEGNKTINFPVTINDYNNRLLATYRNGSTNGDFDLTIANGTYNDIQSLVDAVKSKIDANSIPLDVSVSSNGGNIRLSSKGTGSTYNVSFSSSNNNTLYNIVMNNAVTSIDRRQPVDKKGTAGTDSCYVVGRKDVKNKSTVIEKNTNDELTLDLTINGNTTTLEMKLDEGKYNGDTLVSMIQKKLDKALTDNGFEAGFVQAAIGAKNTGVEGANDANALDFILNPRATFDSAKEENGTYVLDGVGGSAAFHVFYQTDGEMIKAYTMGAKDITEGITITKDNNRLSFTVDNVPCDITIPSGKYSAEKLRETLQELAEAEGAQVNFRLQDGKLKIEHKSLGKHTIANVKGSARADLFFKEGKGNRDNNDVILQMSSESGDIEEIKRHRADSAAIRINGCCLTTVANARKTIGRLDVALKKVSDVRSYLGAKQNRLEHAIRINDNTAENTTAAESRIRDADMAAEVLQHGKANILSQVSEAMITQANQNPQIILNLLK